MSEKLNVRMLLLELREAHSRLVTATQDIANSKIVKTGEYEPQLIERYLLDLVRVSGALAYEIENVAAAVAVEEVTAA